MVRTLAVTSSPLTPSPRVARLHELAVLVAQRDRQAVDLGLGGERHRLVAREPQEALHLLDEASHVVVRIGLLQRQHGDGMADGGELARRRAADPLARAVGALQRREARLDRRIADGERVIVGVGDGRRVVLVVAPVVAGDFGRQGA